MKTQTNYDKQANDFLSLTQTEFKCTFLKHGYHFADDKETRDIYSITLKRGNRFYTFNFGQSLNGSGFYYTKGEQKINLDKKLLTMPKLGLHIKLKLDSSFLNNGKSDIIHYPVAPSTYDVLSCLQKHDVGTFEDFCSEFGYSNDSISALKTYNACLKEFNSLQALFTDSELELLQEIN